MLGRTGGEGEGSSLWQSASTGTSPDHIRTCPCSPGHRAGPDTRSNPPSAAAVPRSQWRRSWCQGIAVARRFTAQSTRQSGTRRSSWWSISGPNAPAQAEWRRWNSDSHRPEAKSKTWFSWGLQRVRRCHWATATPVGSGPALPRRLSPSSVWLAAKACRNIVSWQTSRFRRRRSSTTTTTPTTIAMVLLPALASFIASLGHGTLVAGLAPSLAPQNGR